MTTKRLIASASWGKAKECVQRAIDSGVIKLGKTIDDDLGYRTIEVDDPTGFLSEVPAQWSENHGDPNGGNYKNKIILYPDAPDGQLDLIEVSAD